MVWRSTLQSFLIITLFSKPAPPRLPIMSGRPPGFHDYSFIDLAGWYYPQTKPTDPQHGDLHRVSLFDALTIGNSIDLRLDPITHLYPPHIPYRPPTSKKDAETLNEYLDGFTVPWYGEQWDDEINRKPQQGVTEEDTVIPIRDPFQPSDGGGGSRLKLDRDALNSRKRDYWDVRIWGYASQPDMKANMPKMYFGKVLSHYLALKAFLIDFSQDSVFATGLKPRSVNTSSTFTSTLCLKNLEMRHGPSTSLRMMARTVGCWIGGATS